MIAKLSLFALLTTTAAACTTTESDNILTRGMFASIEARADGNGSTTVSTSLFLGPPSDLIFIDLVAGDQLLAHHGDEFKTMTEIIILNIVSHTATFQGDAEDEEFEIEFRRRVDPGAPSSLVSLPAPFTLGNVPASVSRNVDFGVNWTGSSSGATDRMRWSASGSCIESASGVIAGDPGSVTMPAGTFRKLSGQNVADSCQVTVTVDREREGDVDPAFGEGGTATGLQRRSLTFTSTP
jgi:hypothetical protein